MTVEYIIVIAATLFWGLALGYWTSQKLNVSIKTSDIDKYIDDNFSDLWSAYKKGAHEGYEQGLRDGQGNDEPA